MRAAAIAASHPAWPAPPTTTSNCSVNCIFHFILTMPPPMAGTRAACELASSGRKSCIEFVCGREEPMRMLLHKRALRRECLLLLAILTWSAAFCQVLPGSSDAAQSVSSPDVQRLLTMAEAGDVRSQVKLARAYQSGAGTDPDEIKAFAWLGKAAATGDAQAENELGVAYRAGSGVGRSKEEAVTW